MKFLFPIAKPEKITRIAKEKTTKKRVVKKENTENSVFQQMHNGTRTGEGSFYQSLQKCFYAADYSNRKKLVKAFPDFFGKKLPSWGL